MSSQRTSVEGIVENKSKDSDFFIQTYNVKRNYF